MLYLFILIALKLMNCSLCIFKFVRVLLNFLDWRLLLVSPSVSISQTSISCIRSSIFFFVDVIRFNYLFNAFFMNWFQDYGRWEYYIPIQFLKQLFDCWACFLRISLLVEVVFGFMGLRFLYLTNFICVPPIAISSSTDSGTVVVTCCACLYLL